MQKAYLIIWFLLLGTLASGQDILNLHPKVTLLDLSPEGAKRFNDQLADCETNWSPENCSETVFSYWETEDASCSWYCNGGPDTVTASSYLPAQAGITYLPKNIHNWSYRDAWAEGVPGQGIGESITFSFPAPKPRVGTIIVANGHVKNQTAWENNSRVKKLKVYVNDKPYAILHLEDSRSKQAFRVNPIGNHPDTWEAVANDPNWTLKFEILEVYPGKKYDDTVIAEIYFDGPDSHSMTGDWD